MADNPFYPGYVPSPKGYRGKPIQRPYKYVEPYDFSEVTGAIEAYIDDVEAAFKIPLEQVKEDWRSAWKVTTSASDAGASVPDELISDIDQTAGVTVTMNFNPADWITKPSDQVKDFLNGLVKSTTGYDVKYNKFDPSDLTSYWERQGLWEPLVGKRPDDVEDIGGILGKSLGLGSGLKANIKKRMPVDTDLSLWDVEKVDVDDAGNVRRSKFLDRKDTSKTIVLGPAKYAMTDDQGNYMNYTVEKEGADVFKEYGESFLKFTDKYRSYKYRNSSTRDLQKNALRAIAVEVEQTPNTTAALDKYDNYLTVSKTMSGGKKLKSGTLENSTLDGLIKNVKKESSVGQLLTDLSREVTSAQVKKVDVSREQSKNNAQLLIDLLVHEDATDPAKQGMINHALNQIQQARSGIMNVGSTREVAKFNARVKDYEKYLTKLKADLSEIDLDSDTGLFFAGGKIFDMQGKLANQKFGGGIEDKFLNTVFDDILVDKDIGEHLTGGRRVQAFGRIARYKYDQSGVSDFLNVIEGGPEKLISTYVVPKVRKYVAKAMPNNIVTNAIMNPTHAFGFAYDPDEKMYGFTKNLMGKNNFSVNINGASYLVNGGKHFEAADKLSKIIAKNKLTDEQLLRLINGDFSVLQGVKIPGSDLEDFERDLAKFRQWLLGNDQAKLSLKNRLLKQNARLGLEFNGDKLALTAANGTKMHGLVAAIGIRQNSPGMVNATWEYAGHLQKLAEKLSFIQNKIFSSRLGRLAKPFVALKESIATAMANGIMAAVIAASGGSAAALAPLRFALQWAIKKSLDIGQAFMVGVFKGDFSAVFRGVEKGVTNIIKTLILITALPIAIIMLVIMFIFNVFFATISPIDTTRSANVSLIGGIYGGSGYIGSGDELRNPHLTVMDTIGNCPGGGGPFITFSNDYGSGWNHPQSDYENFELAARTLSSNQGFVDTVCGCRARGYNIQLVRHMNATGCGEHMGMGRINFYNTCTYENVNYLTYLMGHEIGHAIRWCLYYSANGSTFMAELAQARQAMQSMGRATSLGTYVLHGCSLSMNTTTPSEDFSDMVGNYFVFNSWDCENAIERFCGGHAGDEDCPGGYEAFWQYYQIYRDFIERWVFNGEWLGNPDPGDPTPQ